MQHNQHTGHGEQNHYLRLVGMIVLSFISMYVLMYSMANSFADVYNSLNQVYMAGLMTAPMVVIELWLMSSMYKQKRLNAVVIAASIAAGKYDRFIHDNVIGRFGRAEDVARAVRFFMEPDNYITGQVLTIDGGLTL